MTNQAGIILATQSPYKRALFDRLQLDYVATSADVDEQRKPGEAPADMARRLATAKAAAIDASGDQIVIGADQVAAVDDTIFGKPGTLRRAIRQLEQCAGRAVCFYTAVSVRRGDGFATHVDTTIAHLRKLSDADIRDYVAREQPLHCAGAFKIEALGITLMERVDSEDPTALIGLPLIATARLLRAAMGGSE